MFTKLGIVSVLGGFGIWVFSTISSFMNADNIWVGLTLSSLLGDSADSVVDAVSWLHDPLSTLLYDLPLSGVLVGVGGICLVISLFINNAR